jgi:hypothetical protein
VDFVIGELQLRAGVRTLAADDHPRTFRPWREIEPLDMGDLSDLRASAFLSRPDDAPDARRPRAVAGSIRVRR